MVTIWNNQPVACMHVGGKAVDGPAVGGKPVNGPAVG